MTTTATKQQKQQAAKAANGALICQATLVLAKAYGDYQQVAEKSGLQFGKTLYEWRSKFKAQGKKGQGFLPVLEAAAIPTRTAYYWLEKYEVSAGLRKEETEFTTSSEAEDLRQMMREIDKGTHSRLTEDEKRFIHETAQRVHQRTTNPFANFTFSDLPKSIKLSRYEVCSRFIELLDYETLESAWKKMAAKYHPDRP